MLTIRPATWTAFEREFLASLTSAVLAHLREQLPALIEGIPENKLQERILTAQKRAARYDLVTEVEVIAFVDAGLLLDDPTFDENRENWWAQEILANKFMTTHDKALALLDAAWATARDEDEE